jgi:hypothetical protein
MGRVVRALYAWPHDLVEVGDADARERLALDLAIRGDVSFVVGIFPVGILTLLRRLDGDVEPLARDLERGRLDACAGLTGTELARFGPLATPRPDLAARVREAARRPVEERVAVVFPRLRLVYCWVASSAGAYVPELARRLGPGVAVRDAIYSATEAWCNVPMGDDEPGGPLAVTSAYYEFVEERAWLEGSRDACGIGDLRDGVRYVLLPTAASGVARYVLGDVVETCGAWNGIPRVRFVRKLGAVGNLVGELLDESEVSVAVGRALAEEGVDATWFAFVPDTSGAQPGYDLLIEPGDPSLQADRLDRLAAAAQRALVALTPMGYGYSAGSLRPLRVRRVAPGAYAAWKRRRVGEGTGEAQLKSVHLYAGPDAVPAELRPR